MKFSLNTCTGSGQSLSEIVAEAKAAGITAFDLSATPDCDQLQAADGREASTRLRPLFDRCQVVAVTADHPDLARQEDEGGDEAVTFTVDAVKRAAELGAGVVITSLGNTDVDAWDTTWARAMTALRMVLHQTVRTRVRLAVEITPDDMLNSLKRIRRLLAAIEDPRLGLSLDTGYLYYHRIQLSEVLLAAGERIHHVHLRDATRTQPHRAFGTGEVRFPPIIRALRQHEYAGALSLRLGTPRNPVEAPLGETLAAILARLEEVPAETEPKPTTDEHDE
jgi:sugar phosphate isomerase/epimerase